MAVGIQMEGETSPKKVSLKIQAIDFFEIYTFCKFSSQKMNFLSG